MRYVASVEYEGTNFFGWQRQSSVNSIQEEIENSISQITQTDIKIQGAGRTDAGVHASQMFAHFDFEGEFDKPTLIDRLNSFLPDDIVILSIFPVHPKAHTRFHATSRSYEYRLYLGRNPFLLETTWQLYRYELDVEKMNESASLLLDYIDFKCFSKSSDVNTYNCNVTEAIWKQEDNMLVFHITADRFLRNMVRAIVGTLIDIGLGKNTIGDFKKIIESRSRAEAGFSVPAKGLFLTKIIYPKTIIEDE